MKKTIDDCFFQIQNGANIKQGDVDGGFPITRIETTANDKFNRDRMGYAGITDISKYESYVLEDGDLLMSHINSVQYLGRTVLYVKQTDETIIHGMNLLRLKARRDVINPAYARYCFYGNPFRRQVRKITKKSVNQASFAVKDLKQIKIDIPSLSEQEQIVEILDKLQKIIEMRSNELSTLDELIKARFVEMFGDIKTNEHGWEKCTFKDVSTKITDGEHGTVPRVDESEGYLYFMARNITKEGKIDLSETSFVPRENHEKIYKRCNPEKDDLLLVCVGATIGKCTLVPEIMGEFSMARSVALIKPNKERVTSNFLINLLRSEAIQNDIDYCSHAAAQAGLYTNMINSLEAFVPPMDFQIEFDTFSEQVDKSKFTKQIDSHVS